MIVRPKPPSITTATRDFRQRLQQGLNRPAARIRDGLAFKDAAGRLRWVRCLEYGHGVPRVSCNWFSIRDSVARRLDATRCHVPGWRGEISITPEELPLLAELLASHADDELHNAELPVPEYRNRFWGRGYRWSVAGWDRYTERQATAGRRKAVAR